MDAEAISTEDLIRELERRARSVRDGLCPGCGRVIREHTMPEIDACKLVSFYDVDLLADCVPLMIFSEEN